MCLKRMQDVIYNVKTFKQLRHTQLSKIKQNHQQINVFFCSGDAAGVGGVTGNEVIGGSESRGSERGTPPHPLRRVDEARQCCSPSISGTRLGSSTFARVWRCGGDEAVPGVTRRHLWTCQATLSCCLHQGLPSDVQETGSQSMYILPDSKAGLRQPSWPRLSP